MSDNYHQPGMGGKGLDRIMLFFGDAIWFSDGNGNPAVPPHNETIWAGGPVDEIENPNPVAGTNNFWIQDGYGGFGNNGASTALFFRAPSTNSPDTSPPPLPPLFNYFHSPPL